MTYKVALIDGLRSPIAKENGGLKNIGTKDLGAHVVRELLYKTDFPCHKIDEIVIGTTAPGDECLGQTITHKAGLAKDIPATTVSVGQASGLQALINAAHQIATGQRKTILVAGVDSSSQIAAKDACIQGPQMDQLAKGLCITRDQQDKYAAQSHRRAQRAEDAGRFKDEIVPYIINADTILSKDEGLNEGITPEDLEALQPAHDALTGTVTTGNSARPSDGAAALLLMEEKKARSLGYKPLGYISDFSHTAYDRPNPGLGPAYAIADLLKRHAFTFKDIALTDISEGFAVQVLANQMVLNSDDFIHKDLRFKESIGTLDTKSLNVNGGALALGRPTGMEGVRLALNMIKELRQRQQRHGLIAACTGPYQGMAALIDANKN